jgi:hypothetical protein
VNFGFVENEIFVVVFGFVGAGRVSEREGKNCHDGESELFHHRCPEDLDCGTDFREMGESLLSKSMRVCGYVSICNDATASWNSLGGK